MEAVLKFIFWNSWIGFFLFVEHVIGFDNPYIEWWVYGGAVLTNIMGLAEGIRKR